MGAEYPVERVPARACLTGRGSLIFAEIHLRRRDYIVGSLPWSPVEDAVRCRRLSSLLFNVFMVECSLVISKCMNEGEMSRTCCNVSNVDPIGSYE